MLTVQHSGRNMWNSGEWSGLGLETKHRAVVITSDGTKVAETPQGQCGEELRPREGTQRDPTVQRVERREAKVRMVYQQPSEESALAGVAAAWSRLMGQGSLKPGQEQKTA